MNSEGNLNPYAAPQSNVVPRRGAIDPNKRHASSKWAIVVEVLFLVSYAVTVKSTIAQDNLGLWQPTLSNYFDLAIRLLGLIALLAGRGKPWGYYMGTMALAALLVIRVRNFWINLTLVPGRLDYELIPVGGTCIFLLIYLLYRFIFGLPSRRFYRVTQK